MKYSDKTNGHRQAETSTGASREGRNRERKPQAKYGLQAGNRTASQQAKKRMIPEGISGVLYGLQSERTTGRNTTKKQKKHHQK